ncbi:MAG: hypothetical protein M3Z00_00600 [Actinomycetota bacterium]|nr:hypothetical protein [Actinomycetota bacterium]
MDRRYVGIGLVVAALLAIAVLPGVIGKAVTGAAAVDPTVPVVGGCVVAPNGVYAPFDGGTKGNVAPLVPRARVGPCNSAKAATVLATSVGRVEFGFDQAGSTDIDTIAITSFEYSDAEDRICPDPVSMTRPHIPTSYQWQSGSVRVELEPMVRLQTALVAAEPQSASGSWLACVAQSGSGEPLRVDLTKPAGWADLAACLDAAGLAASRSPISTSRWASFDGCARPHVAQILGGWRSTGGSPGPASFQAACRGFAAAVTRMADPTAGGLLRPEWSQGSGLCLLTVVEPSKRTLTGSLYGIGEAPLPWSH